MGSAEDRGDDYKEPLVVEIHEQALFQTGLMALRRASCSVTLIWVAVMLICGLGDMWIFVILSTLIWIITAYFIDIGQRALAIAIETEEERRESRENYERLSNEICFRKFEKGKRNE